LARAVDLIIETPVRFGRLGFFIFYRFKQVIPLREHRSAYAWSRMQSSSVSELGSGVQNSKLASSSTLIYITSYRPILNFEHPTPDPTKPAIVVTPPNAAENKKWPNIPLPSINTAIAACLRIG
jgi:hypothetical protein